MAGYRKLLSPREVAVKLGRSHDWFLKNRETLHADMFPRPVIGDGPRRRGRYDEGAIDAWLDSKMDPRLRQDRDAIRNVVIASAKYDELLAERLQQGRQDRRAA